jgi:hypothetical protein
MHVCLHAYPCTNLSRPLLTYLPACLPTCLSTFLPTDCQVLVDASAKRMFTIGLIGSDAAGDIFLHPKNVLLPSKVNKNKFYSLVFKYIFYSIDSC